MTFSHQHRNCQNVLKLFHKNESKFFSLKFPIEIPVTEEIKINDELVIIDCGFAVVVKVVECTNKFTETECKHILKVVKCSDRKRLEQSQPPCEFSTNDIEIRNTESLTVSNRILNQAKKFSELFDEFEIIKAKYFEFHEALMKCQDVFTSFSVFYFQNLSAIKRMSTSDYENLNIHAKKIQRWKAKSYRDRKKLLRDIGPTTISNVKKYLHSVCGI